MFGLTILGNNSALPAFDRHPTSQALTWDDQVFLIDCGEGTQMQLSRYRIRRSRINHIFISHLHGDHYFGLIGLITSMGLLNREPALHVYGPPELEAIIKLQLKAADTRLKYDLIFHPLEQEGVILEETKFKVSCFPVKHRIACWGFCFLEKKAPRRLIKENAIAAGIPYTFYSRLQWGQDYRTKAGDIVSNNTVTEAAPKGVSYVYCADTLFDPLLAKYAMGASILYHEATFLKDLSERAHERFHSTAKQAAQLASIAQPDLLLIGHFSSKYEDLAPFLTEARETYDATDLALEGVTYRMIHHH